MAEDFVSYQKFTDSESAENFIAELKVNGIECHLQDTNNTYLKVYGVQPIDFALTVNIRLQDFAHADAVLENYYKKQVDTINRNYYVFEMSNEELMDIINHPFDWGKLDFQLAKHLLNERGIEITEIAIEKIKSDNIRQLSVKESASTFKIIAGFILAFIIPLFAVIIGISIFYNRKILPTGEKFYIHPDSDRKLGRLIIIISVAWTCVFFSYHTWFSN